MRVTRAAIFAVTASWVLAILLISPMPVESYTQWSINDDSTNCRECHGDFRNDNYISPVDGQNWGNLHDLHREDMLNDDCDVCHIGDNRLPVPLDDSTGGDGFESVGCMGCHGVDPDPGNPNEHWGAGLRLHHTNASVPADQNGDTCVDCHSSDPVPPGENVAPSYYFTPDTAHPDKPTDPCNPSGDGFPEDFAGLTIAIDNDGDLDYDEADSDCGASLIFADGFETGDTAAWTSAVP